MTCRGAKRSMKRARYLPEDLREVEKRAAFNQVKFLKATSSDYDAVADVDTVVWNETNITDAAFESTCLTRIM